MTEMLRQTRRLGDALSQVQSQILGRAHDYTTPLASFSLAFSLHIYDYLQGGFDRINNLNLRRLLGHWMVGRQAGRRHCERSYWALYNVVFFPQCESVSCLGWLCYTRHHCHRPHDSLTTIPVICQLARVVVPLFSISVSILLSNAA